MHIQPIGIIHTPFKQKFAIPRQPGLAPAAVGEIHFEPAFNDANTLRGIDAFSHLWLSFYFHATADQGWRATVRPPRLGGNQKVGVFASRSTFRPNPLGLSVVEFAGVEQRQGQLILRVKGVDLLHGTPIVDIKPYLPYADALPAAQAGYAPQPPAVMPVEFSQRALDQISAIQQHPGLKSLIEQILAQDPRPAYRKDKQDTARVYAVELYEFNVRWQVTEGLCHVISVLKVNGY